MAGPHPAKAVLVMRRITARDLARAIGRDDFHLRKILNGRRRASPEVRRLVSEYLGLPERDLFHADESA